MYNLQCAKCSATYTIEDAVYQCSKCGGSLDISYALRGKLTPSEFIIDSPGMWRYRRLLPAGLTDEAITLSEGLTRLHRCDQLQERIGLDGSLYIKDETGNPTGTYKDRPASVGVTVAKLMGAKALAIASDGNAAPSVAAYAARAGLPCFAFMPKTTPLERLIQVQMYGAPVITLDGSVNECIQLAEQGRELFGWHHMSTAGPVNPYQREGSKTIAFEICEQLGWKVPDWVAGPVGGGGLIASLWQGFQELHGLGLIDKLPKLLAAQAAGCAPLVRAYTAGDPPEGIRRWENPDTIATTIEVPYPLDGPMALQAVRESGGTAVAVADEEILAMTRQISSSEGILVEPTAAVSLTAVRKASQSGVVKGTVINVVTGTGLKTLSLFASLWGMGAKAEELPASEFAELTEGERQKVEMEQEVLRWAQSINVSAQISSSVGARKPR